MYRAIVVDDEPSMLEGMRLMIDWSACGFSLAGEASDAGEAIALVEASRPDLVITDIRMPGLSGTDLAARLSREYPDVMVLLFSGYRDFAYAQAAIRAQAFGYLLKPIDPDEVHAALRGIAAELDRRRAEQKEPASRTPRDHLLRRIAFGDDGAEALARCEALMAIDREATVCCAAIEHDPPRGGSGEAVDEFWRLPGAYAFLLTPSRAGVVFRGDADRAGLSARLKELAARRRVARVGVGLTGRGAAGLRDSLRQAIEALGPWFESENDLRIFRAYDEGLPRWLLDADVAGLENALRQRRPAAVARQVGLLEKAYHDKKPDIMYLRVMAQNLEAFVPAEGADGRGSDLRALWLGQGTDADQWMRDFLSVMRALPGEETPEDGAMPDAVRQVMRYIDEEYMRDASIGEIASRLYVNAAYLGQLVRRYTGETFHKHLLTARMTQASRLLKQTQQTVGEIALAVGIKDVDYFSMQFRGCFGVSPNAYRTAEREKGTRA